LQTVGFRRPAVEIAAQAYGIMPPDENE